MRVLIATTGTMGDVAPLTGLGVRLRQDGHEVSVATHARYATMIRACGLGFRLLPGEPGDLLHAMRWRPRRADGIRGGLAVGSTLLPDALPAGEGMLAAMRQGTDIVLASGAHGLVGKIVADALGLPSVGLALQPHYPTDEWAPMCLGRRSLGRTGNLALSRRLPDLTLTLAAPHTRRLCARLGLPQQSLSRRRAGLRSWPLWYGFSSAVVPRPATVPAHVHLTGYWWPHTPRDWRPGPELTDFLQAGQPPVYLGLGSMPMPPARAEEVSRMCLAALRRAKVRGVVQAGWAGLRVQHDDVLTVGEVPHQWLFPRTAAVVHHAGAGTTAAALRAGVPAVAVPIFNDQPFWSERLRRLGVSGGTVPFAELTTDRLAEAIGRAVHNPAHRHRARRIAAHIAAEDGAARAAELLTELAERGVPSRP
ncbi:glycosyltransferase [Streptomyces sp. NPDC013178]|uniref:glycosyltransferase n=1 Tax=unclassified Streptomyces TaxID=2593676 RepID=UPI0033F75C0D